MPREFGPTFQQLGGGWIPVAVHQAGDDENQRAAVGQMIASGSTAETLNDIQQVLRTERGPVWAGALRACERLDLGPCWEALETSLPYHTPREQFTARMAALRRQRTTPEQLFASAEQVIQQVRSLAPGPLRAEILIDLEEFASLVSLSELSVPEHLQRSLNDVRLPAREPLDSFGPEPERKR